MGETSVQAGYLAGITMELQCYNGSDWSTIKTWSGVQLKNAYLAEDWYVVNGTYRLQLTHQSLRTDGTIIESVIKYSKTVTY